jgi:simple sugar transport system permease protein
MTTIEAPSQRKPVEAVGSMLHRLTSRHASVLPTFTAIVVLILVLVGAEMRFNNFLTAGNMSSLLYDNAHLLVLAVGMTFVIVTAGIDLSVGSVMALTGMVGASLVTNGVSAGIAIPVMLVAGIAIGLLQGVLVQYFNVQPFIATLAGMFLARGLTFVVSTDSIRVEDPTILWLRTRFTLGNFYITPTGIIALAMVAIGAYVMVFTRFGRTVYAIGGKEESARLMGLNVARTTVLVYVISGLCGGLAGLILTAYSGAGYPRYGIGAELDVIAIVVIGGTLLTGGSGYVLGSLVGLFVFATIRQVISFMGAEQSWQNIIVGALLLLFIVVQRLIVTRSERQRAEARGTASEA